VRGGVGVGVGVGVGGGGVVCACDEGRQVHLLPRVISY
jgi:hypothetical protein